MTEAFDLTGAMPFDRDANDSAPAILAVPGPFLYIGEGLSAAAFERYASTYNFGRIAPSFLVLHHTAIPSTIAARYPSGAVWDAGEDGMSEARIYQKRVKQLDALANYYQHTLGWDRGPHLFIDDKWIYLFTPMNAVGIHAKEGNSYTKDGRLHYSIGIEVIGYYEHRVWPAPVAANVRAAIGALCTRLDISPTYKSGPAHTPSAHDGSLSSHRDYNKPQCPGAAITEAYYVSAVTPVSPPSAPIKKYKIKGTPVFQREDCTGPIALYLNSGAIVDVDKTYDGKRAHLASGAGFIRLDESVEVVQ